MEASLKSSQGADSARPAALQGPPEVLPNTEKSAKQHDIGLSPEHQDHRLDVIPSESKEPTRALADDMSPSEVNLHSKPLALTENHSETSPQMDSPERSSENNSLKPSAAQRAEEDHRSIRTVIDAPSEHDHKQEYNAQSGTNDAPSEHNQAEFTDEVSSRARDHTGLPQGQPSAHVQLTEASSMSSSPPSQVHDTVDRVEEKIHIDSGPEVLLHEETKPSSSCLNDQPIFTSSNQSFNALMEHSEQNPAHTSSGQSQLDPLRDQPKIGANGNVDPFKETDHGTTERPTERQVAATHSDTLEEPEVSSATLYQTPENQHEVGEKKTLDAILAQSQQLSKELSIVQEPILPNKIIRRAEIDTAAPFESVKAALTIFGERSDWKSVTRPPQMQSAERCALSESELQKAHDDLVHYQDQLSLTQASTAGIFLELKKVKRLIQSPRKPEGTDTLSDKSEPVNIWNSTGTPFPDKPNNELVDLLRQVERVKEELISITVSKDEAVKGLENALSGLNSVLKRVGELTAEKMSLDEGVTDAHIALADAEEQVALLKSGKKVEALNSVPSDFIEKKSEEIKGLESKLEEANALIMNLKEELSASKKVDSVMATSVSETQQEIVKVRLELDQAKSEELTTVGKLATVLEESDDTKAKLEETRQENSNTSVTVEALTLDIEVNRKELESMHEKEHTACATMASLQEELQKVKEALRSARGGEVTALEAKETLPAAIKQAASEADLAKAAAVASKEEVRRAKQTIEQAKAATSTAISRQQAAMKELEAAKASEGMALAELKALTESESQSAGAASCLSEGVLGVSISLEEYSALKHAAIEAEDLAAKKVAEVTALVEDAKASQEKANLKLEEAVKESEKSREELSRAQSKANDAQEAKVTAEGELRKWRAEHDLRRKSGGAPLDPKSVMKYPLHKDGEGENVDKYNSHDREVLFQGKPAGSRDSLAQIMSLEVHSSDKLPRQATMEASTKDRIRGQKSSIIRRLSTLVAPKKRP